jgi:bisphosphoglycerate-dependent phosphoglycerate mutase
MTLEDFRALPNHIVLVRHAQSMGNLDATTYSQIPDYEVPLSPTGWEQATACGEHVKEIMEATYSGDGEAQAAVEQPWQPLQHNTHSSVSSSKHGSC